MTDMSCNQSVSDFLSATEMGNLVGCRPNQRAAMTRWLDERRWRYVLDRNAFPKVARAYFLKKMGVDDVPIGPAYAAGPNLEVRRHA